MPGAVTDRCSGEIKTPSWLYSGLLVSPAYAYVTLSMFLGLSLEINLLLAPVVLAYSTLVFRLFSKKSAEKASTIEIQA